MAGIRRLSNGGFIATYRCVAACGHCLYASSPKREKDYVTPSQARDTLQRLAELGCGGLHIGGGEPFLDIDGLYGLIVEIRKAGIGLDYVETSGYWARGDQRDVVLLERLKEAGLTTLMLSLCPYHAEFVPVKRVIHAVEACRKVGIPTFVWQDQFARELQALGDVNKTHSLAEYEEKYPGGVERLPERFGLQLLGRAALTHKTRAKVPVNRLAVSKPCLGPLQTGHFHVDCFGDFIPPGCTGLAVGLSDVGNITDEKNPAVHCLTTQGVGALMQKAQARGFVPDTLYESACALCQHVRAYLATQTSQEYIDLRPMGFYKELYPNL